MKNTSLIVGFVVLLLLYACSGNETNEKDSTDMESIPQVELSKHLKMDDEEVRMFTMPTPLQISTALKMMNIEYNDKLLLPNYNESYNSDINLAVGLGAYVVDMGYTTVYNNYQKSIHYGNNIQQIMEKLHISHYINKSLVERFKKNIDNQDSLCQIILSTYSDAHSYFNQDEGLGLLILTGAYIEGLYFATQSLSDQKWVNEKTNLYIQQKLFLDNFILLLSAYSDNSKINTIVSDLTQLKVSFDEIKIISGPEKVGDYSLVRPITKSNTDDIKKQVARIRKVLLNTN
ncbi:MAG: hypothetical protein AB7O47_02215 [Flavobacteriales bacterium]